MTAHHCCRRHPSPYLLILTPHPRTHGFPKGNKYASDRGTAKTRDLIGDKDTTVQIELWDKRPTRRKDTTVQTGDTPTGQGDNKKNYGTRDLTEDKMIQGITRGHTPGPQGRIGTYLFTYTTHHLMDPYKETRVGIDTPPTGQGKGHPSPYSRSRDRERRREEVGSRDLP
jgi:hypothetical protein